MVEIGIRDSKNPTGPALVFTPPEVGRLHRRREQRRVRSGKGCGSGAAPRIQALAGGRFAYPTGHSFPTGRCPPAAYLLRKMPAISAFLIGVS
ncbi:DUF397 domain-containing protein [Nocardia sp. CA-135953]|uniref:DUF397 domain-containing protein n=1 Tax=Nocardia sp. CA-135953 TaxID=3239978 RepID=UPI003D95E04E